MGKIRNTSHWTQDEKQKRMSAAHQVLDAIRMVNVMAKEQRQEKILIWLLSFGSSTTKLLTTLTSEKSTRLLSAMAKDGLIHFTQRVVATIARESAHGKQVKIMTIAIISKKGASLLKKRGIEVPRQMGIEDQKFLRHNLTVQAVAIRLCNDIESFQMDHRIFVPRVLQTLPRNHELRKSLKNARPDALIEVDTRGNLFYEDHSLFNELTHASQTQFFLNSNQIGFAIEVELSKKTDKEIDRFVHKLHALKKMYCVVLVTATRGLMDSLTRRLEQWQFNHVPFTTKDMKLVVMNEAFPGQLYF